MIHNKASLLKLIIAFEYSNQLQVKKKFIYLGGRLAAVVCEQSNHVLTYDVDQMGDLNKKEKIDFATTEG